MKKTFLILTALIIAVIASAGVKNATTLCIEDKTNGVMKFYLSQRPKLSFRGNYAIVQAGETKLLQFRNLVRAYFTDEDDPTAINEVAADGEQIDCQIGNISLSGFKPLTRVLVYTPAGTLVKKAQADVQGTLDLSLADLPSGIYVVKVGKTTFKMQK